MNYEVTQYEFSHAFCSCEECEVCALPVTFQLQMCGDLVFGALLAKCFLALLAGQMGFDIVPCEQMGDARYLQLMPLPSASSLSPQVLSS